MLELSALLLILSFAVLALRYPHILAIGFIALVILFPKLPVVTIQGFIVPLRIEDIYLALSLLVILIYRSMLLEPPPPNPIIKYILGFSFVLFVSLLYNHSFYYPRSSLLIGVLYAIRPAEYFAASLICLFSIRTWKQYHHVMNSILVCIFLLGIYGLLQEYSLVPVFSTMHQDADNSIISVFYLSGFANGPLQATFAGPYELANFYILAIPICITLLANEASRLRRTCILGVIGLSLLCFYLTFTRTPVIAFTVATTVTLFLFGWRRFALSAFVVLPLIVFFVPTHWNRFALVLADPVGEASFGSRLWGRGLAGGVGGTWSDAIESFLKSPLLGTGPVSLGTGVDCIYLTVLGISGILGLASFFLVLFKTIELVRNELKRAKRGAFRSFSIGLFSASIGYLISGMTVDVFFNSKTAFVFWFLVGLFLAGRHLERPYIGVKISVQKWTGHTGFSSEIVRRRKTARISALHGGKGALQPPKRGLPTLD